MEFVSVYVTCPDEATAERVARELLERRLVACANILGGVRSLYRWEGRIQDDREVAMFLKTRRELLRDVEAAVRATHPYDTPCVVAFDLLGGSKAYFDWVAQETCASPAGSSAGASPS